MGSMCSFTTEMEKQYEFASYECSGIFQKQNPVVTHRNRKNNGYLTTCQRSFNVICLLSFNRFVTSAVVRIATRRKRLLPGRDLHPLDYYRAFAWRICSFSLSLTIADAMSVFPAFISSSIFFMFSSIIWALPALQIRILTFPALNLSGMIFFSNFI